MQKVKFHSCVYSSVIMCTDVTNTFTYLHVANRRAKHALLKTTSEERKRSAEKSHLKIACEGYELEAVELSNEITDITKELNGGSIKLEKIMKSMLRNVVEGDPSSNTAIK